MGQQRPIDREEIESLRARVKELENHGDCSHGAHGPWCREWRRMEQRAEQAERERDEAQEEMRQAFIRETNAERERDAARAEVERWKTRANDHMGTIAAMRGLLQGWCDGIEGNGRAPYDETRALLGEGNDESE